MSDEPCLYLFTSNLRPLYAQDAIDLLAAPEGLHHRFRYRQRWISPDARGLANAGENARGHRILVVFSLQQKYRYHDPAYIPLRWGSLLGIHREGSAFVVSFELEKYASLPLQRVPETGRLDEEKLGDEVQRFSASLSQLLGQRGHPGADDEDQRFSATVGKTLDGVLDPSNDQSLIWEQSVTYLGGTLTFAGHRFFRIDGIRREAKGEREGIENGRYELTSGVDYELAVVHHQPREVSGVEHFIAEVDGEIVQLIGEGKIEISSEYDRVPVLLHLPRQEQPRDATVVIRPEGSTQGPRVALPMRSRPGKVRTAVASALGASVVVAAALPGIFGSWPGEVRALVVSAGALAAVGIPFSLRIGR